ncbi:MAG: 3-hydroxyacyl-CoA dehydrogenase NAD-binding domain-containing protein [Woeseia sp.]
MSPVNLARHGRVSVITIDNPPVNALSQAVRRGLVDCLDEAEADASARAIVLVCSGRTFIAGADIREFDRPPEEPHLPDVVSRIEAAGKPVLAAIHGTALGGGLEIAMGCHYRLAARTAAMGLPEVKLGLLPGASGTQRLPRLVGAERALDMMLSGDPMQAEAALESGLVDKLADGDLLSAALQYADEVSGRGLRRVRDLEVEPVASGFFDATRKRIAAKTRGLLSPEKIIRCVELATRVDFDTGCAAERDFFLECKNSPQSSGLRHAFFAERGAARVPGIGKETSVRTVESVAVIGAGTMGAGIAYNCLTAGLAVHLLDNDEQGLARGSGSIRKLFEGGVERGKLAEREMHGALQRFRASVDYREIRDVDLVIEAVFENMTIKKEVFARLDAVCKPGAILATNTSTLDVDEIASATNRPQDVVGLHFFSPAHIMRLLEVVRGANTAKEVLATTMNLARTLGKVAVVVGNCFGFVGNRMLYSYGRENQLLLLEGAAPEFIDRVLYEWGMAMGPNAVGDLAGLDVGYKVRQERKDLPDDPLFYRVADMLAELGRFGQKTGKGIYRYEEGSRTPLPDPEVQRLIRDEAARLGIEQRQIGEREIIERCVYGLVTEGARILEDAISHRSSDIDVVWINGYGFPRHRGGPMHFADTIGAGEIYRTVRDFAKRFGPMYWQPPELLRKLAEEGGRFGDIAG